MKKQWLCHFSREKSHGMHGINDVVPILGFAGWYFWDKCGQEMIDMGYMGLAFLRKVFGVWEGH